ncbi:MAG: FAD-dependent oxidoreductase [Pseudomonadota bacterium]
MISKQGSGFFEHIRQPITIGNFTLKNRIVLAPAHVGLTTPSGGIGSEFIGYMEERAKGGVSMVIMGVGLVEGKNQTGSTYPRFDEDRYIPNLFRLTERIHFHNCLACAQLFHPGRFSKDEPISASDIPGYSLRQKYFKPRAMTVEEIEDMIEYFGDAALRAKRANFDMVELHGATGYLILQFYSPRTNKRTDKYGGHFENRIRFPLEIVKRIKEKCGDDFPIGFRVVGDELLPDGFKLEEAKLFARRLEEVGVSYLSVTAGTVESRFDGEGMWSIRSPQAPSVPVASAIKKEVGIPVMTNGQINDPAMMEEILSRGMADIIALARPLFSDPDLPNKVIRGKVGEVRKCTHCCQCFWYLIREWPVTCFQNPEMGKELEYRLSRRALRRKKLLVIGGGPGGLEAARVAAIRGHDVTLWEKDENLGGQLLLASKLPGKEVFNKYTIQWLVRECEKAGVKTATNKDANAEDIEAFEPEAVIAATGASPYIPDIPGINRKNVWKFTDIITEEIKLENKKIVIIGGGLIGSEIAILLRMKENKITLVEILPQLAVNMDPFNRAYLLNKIKESDITVLTNTKAIEINESKVVCVNKEQGTSQIECEDVVIAAGTVPNNNIAHQIRPFVGECFSIGDCVKPRTALEAIHEGSYFGRMI